MIQFTAYCHLIFCVLFIYSAGYTNNLIFHKFNIIDADTIHVLHQGQKVKIRLYGIDAPEKKQNYGKEAIFFLENLLHDKEVSILPVNKDRYGRVVAMVYVEGVSLQKILLEHGLVWIYPRYCKMMICEDWELLQEQAKAHKKGLWQDQNPMPPWVWRKK